MAYELIYTSAARGLHGPANGFTTVVQTRGLPAPIAAILERLASYRRLGGTFAEPPVKYLHQILRAKTVGGKLWHVVGRIAPSTEEVSGRDNFLAHFVVLDESELPAGGPAWLLQQPGFMQEEWFGEVGERAEPKIVPQGDFASTECPTWQFLTGYSGWANWLARSVDRTPTAPVHIIYGTDGAQATLDLIAEAQALVPSSQRWTTTFTTIGDNSSNVQPFEWSLVPVGTPEAKRLLNQASVDSVLNLTSPLDPPPRFEIAVPAQKPPKPTHRTPSQSSARPHPRPVELSRREAQSTLLGVENDSPVRPQTSQTEPAHSHRSTLAWAVAAFFALTTIAMCVVAAFFLIERNNFSSIGESRIARIEELIQEKRLLELDKSTHATKLKNVESQHEKEVNNLRGQINTYESKQSSMAISPKPKNDGSKEDKKPSDKNPKSEQPKVNDEPNGKGETPKAELKIANKDSNDSSGVILWKDTAIRVDVANRSVFNGIPYDETAPPDAKKNPPQNDFYENVKVHVTKLTRLLLPSGIRDIYPSSKKEPFESVEFRIQADGNSKTKFTVSGVHKSYSVPCDVCDITLLNNQWRFSWRKPNTESVKTLLIEEETKGSKKDEARINTLKQSIEANKQHPAIARDAGRAMKFGVFEAEDDKGKKVYFAFRDKGAPDDMFYRSHNEFVYFHGFGKVQKLGFKNSVVTIEVSSSNPEFECFQVFEPYGPNAAKVRVELNSRSAVK